MTKRFHFLPVLLLVLGLCLLLPASALGWEFGERAYGECDSVTLTSDASVAQVLDWLDDFLEDEVGYAMESTTDLMEMIQLVQDNPATAAQLPVSGENYKKAMDVYTRACDQNAEVSYYYDRLIALHAQNTTLREQIKSGEFTQDVIDEMKRELDQVVAEAAQLRTEAIAKQSAWKADMGNLQQSLLDGSADNPGQVPKPYITAVRELAQDILHQQAADIAGQENGETKGPVVTVISTKEIAFTAVYRDEDKEMNVGIPGVTVTMWESGHPEKKQTKQTDKDGVVTLWVADFKPNARGIIELEVEYDGSTATNGKKYRNRELGRLWMEGGDIFNYIMVEDNGEPYIVRATIDDLDMSSINNGYALSRFNTIDHTVALKLETKGQPMRLLGWYYTGGKLDWDWKKVFEVNFTAGDTATHKINGKFLQYGSADCLPDSRQLYFSMYQGNSGQMIPGDSGERRSSSSFSSSRSSVEQPSSGKDKEAAKGLIGKLGFTIPASVPFIGGAKLEFPIESGWTFMCTPGSMYYLGYNREIKPEKTDWKSEGKKQQESADKAIKKSEAGAISKAGSRIKEDYMASMRSPFLGESSLTITPFFFVSVQTVKWGSAEGAGNFGIGLIVSYNLTLTHEFAIGPVPAFISLDANMSLTVGVSFIGSARLQPNGTYKDFKLNKSGGVNFNIAAHVGISLTVGAGLPRVAYLGLRAGAAFDFSIGLGGAPVKPQLELFFHADVVVKILFFSKEWTFWDIKASVDPSRMAGMQAQLLQTSLTATAENMASASAAPRISSSNERSLLTQQQFTSGDAKCFAPSTDYVDAFSIRKKADGKDELRWDRAYADGRTPQSRAVPFGNLLSGGYYYMYEFDMDYHNGTYYLIATVSKKGHEQMPDTEAALKERRMENQQYIGCVLGSFTPAKFDDPNWSQIDTNRRLAVDAICYLPRIKALYQPKGDTVFVVAGMTYRAGTEHLIVSTNVMAKYDAYFITERSARYGLKDIQLLDHIAADGGISFFCVESDPETHSGALAFGVQGQNGGSYGRIRIDNKNVNCVGISPQIWENRSSDTRTAFLLSITKEDGSMGQKQLSQTTAVMYIDRSNNCRADLPTRTLKIKDMGVNASSDGVHAVTIKVNNEYQAYAYWGESQQKDKTKEYEYLLKACLIDMKSQLCTEPFTWLKTEKALEKIEIQPITDVTKPAHATYISPNVDSKTKKINNWDLREIVFKLSPEVALRAFAPEYPAVTQGKDFSMFFRLENTGDLVIKAVDIDVRGVKTDSGAGDKEVQLKRLHIDMTNPQANSVTHSERDASAANYVTSGAHTVYRVGDVRDSFNGEIVQTTTYENGTTTTQTEFLKALLPGAVRTYKTTVTQSPTTWHGKYALFAKVVKMQFQLAVGEYTDGTQPTVYEATWNEATDSFDIAQLDASGQPMARGSADPIALFGCNTPDKADYGNAGGPDTATVNVETYDALNAGLTRGDELYANINNNDLEIDADLLVIDNVRYAVINLKNDCLPTSPDVTPRVVAKIVNDDNQEITTYTRALKTNLGGGFTRSFIVPMSELTGGKPYGELHLYVESADGKPYYEINQQTTVATLESPSAFAVSGPDDQTVYEGDGQNATFTVQVSAPPKTTLTYQWKVVYPDGVSHDLLGETGATLTLKSPKLGQSGLQYWCAVSDGVSIRASRAATLTVLNKAPVTGDSSLPMVWLALMLGAAAAGAILLVAKKRRA